MIDRLNRSGMSTPDVMREAARIGAAAELGRIWGDDLDETALRLPRLRPARALRVQPARPVTPAQGV